MKVTYDKPGDILYVHLVAPTASQVMREIAEGVYVLVNKDTKVVEGYEVHGLAARPGEFTDVTLPASLEARTLV